ncbi:alpha/beta hydrolase family protein [Microbacter margulisiae]|uniref:Alpha/beta hydrolase n=1 Tax=Microbacter margulisiae TaxID=1350067 RepID=A0A7W5DPR2_9PORP|nr:alpha/beta hydrolase [Microbacter margulisiae]MBB3186820.1 hypothetical protein [Microbacter margulisiae]
MKQTYILLLFLLFISLSAFSQVTKSTFIYSVKGQDTLRLDRYELAQTDTVAAKPCIIFMFGGGFIGGKRDNPYYLPYFDQMAQRGYVMVSIDYRLGLKKTAEQIHKGEKIKKMAFPGLLASAIDTAVADLYNATDFILSNASDWHINPAMVIINGSSAGAISVLQAEYYLCSNNKLINRLPEGFGYAGVIAFAGAIFTTKGSLHWDKKPAPVQFFQGDADNHVPYNKVRLFNYGFYGSKNLAGQLKKMKSPYYFYDVENAAHEIAGTPMKSNLPEIEAFLRKEVEKKLPLEIHEHVRQTDKPQLKKKFGIGDYIKANFKQ